MSRDNLEKYIQENRSEFDNNLPSEKVWQNVSKKIKPEANFQWIWKVAAVIFFCSSLFLVVDRQNTKSKLIAQKEKLSSDFGAIETFYFQIISEKRELIYDYDTGDKPIEVDFEQDLQKLDAMYEVLKEELKRNPSKKVVDALILNLLVRLDVLNEKIEELEGVSELEENPNKDMSI